MQHISLALNICTYHRSEYVKSSIQKLSDSFFMADKESKYYGKLHVFVIDNGEEYFINGNEYIHYIPNHNTGGSGGFQRGLEEIRKYPENFSHVIFMDDDVKFETNTFYLLFDFLENVDSKYEKYPVAGRMFCMDRPNIQYTAAEIWNRSDLRHVEFMREITPDTYDIGKVVFESGADYGGWWFCCYPMAFTQENDIIPFFIHCDDVEYGLRCGLPPIIIEGVQVWHETYEHRQTPIMQYYDTRNPLLVNELYGLLPSMKELYNDWKTKISFYHAKGDWLTEYYIILGMNDFLKGLNWLKRIDSGKKHKKLTLVKSCKLKNCIMWRIVAAKMKLREFCSKITLILGEAATV